MANMDDVRRALYNAYKLESEGPDGVEGKRGEGYCQLLYPTWWDCKTEEEFLKPCGIMVYSYALGPSREHYFMYAEKEGHPNYYTWEAPDFMARAIEVINSWGSD